MRLALLPLCLASVLAHADAVLIDRVVAVVDTHAITRSAVEDRAQPLLVHAKTAAEKSRARQDALTELIEDHLIHKDAQRIKLEVTDDEVEKALGTVADQNRLTQVELAAELKRQGFDGEGYRSMLKRKILELKWLNLRANRPAQPPTDAQRGDLMARERTRLLAELKAHAVVEVRP